jgi:hypothetical protein
MAMQTFTLSVGAQLDTTQMTATMTDFYNQVAKNPVMVNTQVARVDTGNAQALMNDIKSQAKSIDSITVKEETWQRGKKQVTGLTEQTIVWRDALGNVHTNVQKITSKLDALGSQYKKVSADSAKYNIGAQNTEISKEYDKRLKTFAAMEAKANEWATRAQNMSEKEKQGILQASAALKAKIELYRQGVNNARATGSAGGLGGLADDVVAQNEVMNESIAVTKRAATGIRGWADSIGNAIKQTISYTFTLGGMRAAQQLLNEGIQYTIQLNKEMVNVQLLQAEGAQTDAEINALAGSYNKLAREMGVTTLEVAKGSVEWLFNRGHLKLF